LFQSGIRSNGTLAPIPAYPRYTPFSLDIFIFGTKQWK
jgi:hypothetical protein